ncbi:MAG TPA: hypothetical protein VNL70_08600, partial [Tepidisphaeraceae bacterium]|nr:hypothetical protein [Tepidisphaeraceae bacterium]
MQRTKRILSAAITASVGSIFAATASMLPAATTTITGSANFFQVAAGPGGTIPITDWGGIPGRPDVAYPELELREWWGGAANIPENGAFDQRVFLRINLSQVPAGSIVTEARFNLFWLDTYESGAHSDYVDLWSVADRVESGANYNTSNGTTPWTDGFIAGVNGYARTGPAGRHLGFLWHSAAAPAGTPSKHIIDLNQEYKEFVSDAGALEAYLTQQLASTQEANFQLSIGNGNAGWQRFIAASDDGTF